MNLEQAINQIYDLKYEWECEGLLTKLNQTDINAMGIIISNLEELQHIIDELEKWLEDYIKLYDNEDLGIFEDAIVYTLEEVLYKLQELKGSDK